MSTPSPFSREGSNPADALGGQAPPTPQPTSPPAATPPPSSHWPTYPTPEPFAAPTASSSPDPFPAAVYAPGGYGSNPYEPVAPAVPYGQPAFGSYSPYGFVPQQHPQAVLSMVLGIIGLAVCPFVGIAGLVIGRRVRNEIDAQPGRWGGRGQATAGFVLGIISVVYAVLIIAYIVFVVAIIGTAGFSDF